MARTSRRTAATTGAPPPATSDNVVASPAVHTNGAAAPDQTQSGNEQLLAALSGATPGRLTEVFLALRAERSKISKADDILKARQDLVAGLIMQKMKDLGEEGFRAAGHTVYTYDDERWVVADKEQFRAYVTGIENGLDLVNMTPNKEACDHFMNEYGEPPDGAVKNVFVKLGVRKV